jgi:hypothetical protein
VSADDLRKTHLGGSFTGLAQPPQQHRRTAEISTDRKERSMSTRPRVLVLGDPQGWALLGSRFDATPVRDVPTADAALIVSASGQLDKATVGAVLAARASTTAALTVMLLGETRRIRC